jgi:hypothetical protein
MVFRNETLGENRHVAPTVAWVATTPVERTVVELVTRLDKFRLRVDASVTGHVTVRST